MRASSWVFVAVVCLGAGCGGMSEKSFEAPPGKSVGQAEAPLAGGAAGEGKPPPAERQPAAADPRKIIYTATIDVRVDNLDAARERLEALILEKKGYVASSDVDSQSGRRRAGTWVARIPVEQYGSFLEAVAQLGEVGRSTSTAEDVTEEFYDVEARLKNKRVEEERLLDHLKKSTGKLEDILAVERELSRVRGEIERTEGRLQYLSNRVALTTVTVTLSELSEYVPESAPSFTTRASRAFGGSVDLLVNAGEGVALGAVAVVPWLPVLAVFLFLGWLARRSRRRSRHGGTTSP